MRKRKRYYRTTSGHGAGIDIAIREPNGGVIATVLGLSLFDDGSAIEEAKANARMIVKALNAYQKRDAVTKAAPRLHAALEACEAVLEEVRREAIAALCEARREMTF